MDKERIDGFRSAFAPGETLFWQVPAAARERMAFYRENLPRLFAEKITAVFAVSDHYALEFMRFLQGQGIRVPEDVRKQNARSPWRFGHGGRAFYVYFPSTTESLISFSVSLRSRAPPSATVTCSS